MKIATTLFLFVVVGCTWRETLGTCVFQSDFGFALNCAFKKSGLFRIRNLGGLKGYVGLGFSVGDELGFQQSLSNLEASKRRSVQLNRGNAVSLTNTANRKEVRQTSQNTQVVPPFKPLPPGVARPMAQQPERQKLVVQQNSTTLKTLPIPALTSTQHEMLRQQMQQEAKRKQQQRVQQEALALQVLKQQRIQQQEAMRQQHLQKLQQQQKQLAQQQKRQQLMTTQTKRDQMPQIVAVAAPVPARLPNIVAAIPPAGSVVEVDSASKSVNAIMSTGGLPPFIAIPQSAAQLTD